MFLSAVFETKLFVVIDVLFLSLLEEHESSCLSSGLSKLDRYFSRNDFPPIFYFLFPRWKTIILDVFNSMKSTTYPERHWREEENRPPRHHSFAWDVFEYILNKEAV